jgi:hypothetical protein
MSPVPQLLGGAVAGGVLSGVTLYAAIKRRPWLRGWSIFLGVVFAVGAAGNLALGIASAAAGSGRTP